MNRQLSESYLNQYYWYKDQDAMPWRPYVNGIPPLYAGKITAQADAGDFDVDNRTDALVEALSATKKVLIRPPNGVVAIELRFRADGTAADQHVLEVFAAAGVDHYNLVATLTIDQGTQIYTSGSIYFCDTIVPSNEKWLTTQTELTDTSNHIGGYTMNMHGYDRLWIVASTLDTAGGSPNLSNLYVDWKQL